MASNTTTILTLQQCEELARLERLHRQGLPITKAEISFLFTMVRVLGGAR